MSYKLECRISIDEVVIITNDKKEIVNDKDSMYSLGVFKIFGYHYIESEITGFIGDENIPRSVWYTRTYQIPVNLFLCSARPHMPKP